MFRYARTMRVILFAALCAAASSVAFAADDIQKYIPSAGAAQKGMSLWQMIVAGGWLMFVLLGLSIGVVALVTYFFMFIKKDRLVPDAFFNDSRALLEKKKYDEARSLCAANDNLISGVILSGLDRLDHDKLVVKEAMEDQGRRGVEELWQKLSYLSDIAVIAPLVGLLGTVFGMIQAFNVIAFEMGTVKPIVLAAAIAKAMINTASGILIAVPAMMFFAYFRGVVQDITCRLETASEDLFHSMTKGK